MNSDSAETLQLLQRAREGEMQARSEVFLRHRERLRSMVLLRLDRRLQGRIDPSDVLQEAFVEVSRCLDEYLRHPKLPVFLWLRLLTGRKLQALHRHHLGTRLRDAGRELSLHSGVYPEASSIILAHQLLDKNISPSQQVEKAEVRLRVQQALDSMAALDREVLALRHFEQLSNAETAQVLGVSEAAASVRFIRALERLKAILAGIPGFLPGNSGDR
jgi:RNA polymerase sigma-70 factor (ECF subfamily)